VDQGGFYNRLEGRFHGTVRWDEAIYFPRIKPSDVGLRSWLDGAGSLQVVPRESGIGAGIAFEESLVYRACRAVFLEGGQWESTEYFRKIMSSIESGNSPWGCRNRTDLVERLTVDVEGIWRSMVKHGFLSQEDILGSDWDPQSEFAIWRPKQSKTRRLAQGHEIQIAINEEGDFVLLDGRHRLAIAKLLKLQSIPVECILIDRDSVKILLSKGFYSSSDAIRRLREL
jgi:hypothetical protein